MDKISQVLKIVIINIVSIIKIITVHCAEENWQFVPGAQQNRACQVQARLELTRTVLAYSSSRMHSFGELAKLVSHA